MIHGVGLGGTKRQKTQPVTPQPPLLPQGPGTHNLRSDTDPSQTEGWGEGGSPLVRAQAPAPLTSSA